MDICWRFQALEIGGRKSTCTYIWIDGTGEKLRSKCRQINRIPSTAEDVPRWTFGGSATGQAEGVSGNLEIILKPVVLYKDPFIPSGFIVLCETLHPDGQPTTTNHRRSCLDALIRAEKTRPRFGFEQEFFMIDHHTARPVGWPILLEPPQNNDHYCGVGAQMVGRKVVDTHMNASLYAGVNIYGTNAESVPAQWEFQTGPTEGIKAGDDLWTARYILTRVAEESGIDILLNPKPFEGRSGSGCHTNFSTKAMRQNGGMTEITVAIERLGERHNEHKSLTGRGNENRLTGQNCTSHYNVFNHGVGDKSCSIRIPFLVFTEGKGYLEDRRPGANCDPYQVMEYLVNTCCPEETKSSKGKPRNDNSSNDDSSDEDSSEEDSDDDDSGMDKAPAKRISRKSMDKPKKAPKRKIASGRGRGKPKKTA